MDSDPFPLTVDLILVFILVFLNGFFVSMEFAMVKVRGARIDTLAQEGNSKAKFVSRLADKLDAYLFACRLGITLASLGLGWLGGPVIASVLAPALHWLGLSDGWIQALSIVFAFLIVAALHIVLGELAPRTMAVRQAEKITQLAAAPLIVFRKLMSPYLWLLDGISRSILKLFGIEPASEISSARTEEEIRILMKESHESGLIDNTELTLVDNIFEFAETNAHEIMIPRTDMICLYTNLSFEENKTIALKEMHTRYPLCDGDKDNIIGFVHIKDLLKATDGSVRDIGDLLRPMLTVPESMPISTLLKLMQKKKSQIAILIDEYGGTSGLVTLEDIMEEIVGEIQDEFDEERPDLEKKDDQSYSISGMMLIEEVNRYFGLDIPTDNYDTIGGWMYSQIEIPPSKRQTVEVEGGFLFVVEETDNLRISRIQVKPIEVANWAGVQAETG
ncbi:hemolysin family protein [Cohnella algarum]|uniref:hemolysin family protein n=1 Tax=Cohnella algarum TaxID=2044859 RepID=UPI001F07F3EE|nr:hemolysin family protein [Cohnella algarum]